MSEISDELGEKFIERVNRIVFEFDYKVHRIERLNFPRNDRLMCRIDFYESEDLINFFIEKSEEAVIDFMDKGILKVIADDHGFCLLLYDFDEKEYFII